MTENVEDITLHRLNRLQASVDSLTDLVYVMLERLNVIDGKVDDMSKTMASAGKLATVEHGINRLNRNFGDLNNRVKVLELDAVK